MKRISITPRTGWQSIVSGQGLLYHTTDTGIYWNESACYEFSMAEIEAIEKATNTLQQMCLAAGQYIIDRNLFGKMGISDFAAGLIRASWEAEPPAIYGRFDLAYNGRDIKMLEYNADTPTSLLEASVIQWFWLKDCFPSLDQFNSIHERLIAKWRELVSYVGSMVHFAGLDNDEDTMTVSYLMDTAKEAGLEISSLPMSQIGFDANTGNFVDLEDRRIETLFKLYPWENMVNEDFAKFIPNSGTQFMEPAWKMLWSNKALLAVLWEMYPNHPLLLPAYFDKANFAFSGGYVRKPFISREGANVSVVRFTGSAIVVTADTDGPYAGPYVYQQNAELVAFEGKYPVIGSWVVDGEAAGIGIREDQSKITGNRSQFVPHVIR